MRGKQNESNNRGRNTRTGTANKRVDSTSTANRSDDRGSVESGNTITATPSRSGSIEGTATNAGNGIAAIEKPTADSAGNTGASGTGTRTGNRIDNTAGARTGARTGTDRTEENSLVNGVVAELAPEPLPIKKRKYTKRAKSVTSGTDELVKLAILTAINTTASTLFNTVAIFTKDAKWKLNEDESLQLTQDLDGVLALLPESQYELIIKYLTTISPFAALATTLTAIIKKRIETPKTTNTVTGTSAPSVANASASKPENNLGDWRYNPAYTITGVNH